MITLKISPDSGDAYTLTATSRDIYTWEKTSRGKVFAAIMQEAPMVDLYEIAHIAARRQGLFSGTVQEFAASCDLEMAEDEEPDPTQSAP